MSKFTLFIIATFFSIPLLAQFPGSPGSEGSTAIHKDSSIIIGWATGCTLERGYQNILNPSQGFANVGDSSSAIGKADGVNVVSLGDGGVATLTFEHPIRNGQGFDFAVFENSFSDNFLELAFVEVSSDGINFVRFPATSLTQTNSQIGAFDSQGDPTLIHNLAGKYRANYGTPFDLEELAGHPLLDIQAVTHVRIVDVIGSIDPEHASYDNLGNPINDPFPTPFGSSGFDLDAVAVMYRQVTGITNRDQNITTIYPNPLPFGHSLQIKSQAKINYISIHDNLGRLIYNSPDNQLGNIHLPTGSYWITLYTDQSHSGHRIIVE